MVGYHSVTGSSESAACKQDKILSLEDRGPSVVVVKEGGVLLEHRGRDHGTVYTEMYPWERGSSLERFGKK